MAKFQGFYKCNICGNIVQVVHSGGGTLVCCGEEMHLLSEKTYDEGLEKHVPVIEIVEDGVYVKIGSVPHPMEDTHYIEWIELTVDGYSCKKYLNPGDKPEAHFSTKGHHLEVREYCNIHGLWKANEN